MCVCVDDHIKTTCTDVWTYVCKFYPRPWLAGSWASTIIGKQKHYVFDSRPNLKSSILSSV